MRRSNGFAAACVATAVAVGAAVGVSQGQPEGMPDMSPQDKAMMEEMAKLAAIGEPHRKLQGLVGKWKSESNVQMAPGAPEVKSTGQTEYTSAVGGRWVQHTHKGQMFGQPFEGLGLLGYDNAKQKYVSTWADSMSTGILMSEGTASPDGKTITFAGSFDMMGQTMRYRFVYELTSADSHSMTWFEVLPDGKEHQSFKIVYTRAK